MTHSRPIGRSTIQLTMLTFVFCMIYPASVVMGQRSRGLDVVAEGLAPLEFEGFELSKTERRGVVTASGRGSLDLTYYQIGKERFGIGESFKVTVEWRETGTGGGTYREFLPNGDGVLVDRVYSFISPSRSIKGTIIVYHHVGGNSGKSLDPRFLERISSGFMTRIGTRAEPYLPEILALNPPRQFYGQSLKSIAYTPQGKFGDVGILVRYMNPADKSGGLALVFNYFPSLIGHYEDGPGMRSGEYAQASPTHYLGVTCQGHHRGGLSREAGLQLGQSLLPNLEPYAAERSDALPQDSTAGSGGSPVPVMPDSVPSSGGSDQNQDPEDGYESLRKERDAAVVAILVSLIFAGLAMGLSLAQAIANAIVVAIQAGIDVTAEQVTEAVLDVKVRMASKDPLNEEAPDTDSDPEGESTANPDTGETEQNPESKAPEDETVDGEGGETDSSTNPDQNDPNGEANQWVSGQPSMDPENNNGDADPNWTSRSQPPAKPRRTPWGVKDDSALRDEAERLRDQGQRERDFENGTGGWLQTFSDGKANTLKDAETLYNALNLENLRIIGETAADTLLEIATRTHAPGLTPLLDHLFPSGNHDTNAKLDQFGRTVHDVISILSRGAGDFVGEKIDNDPDIIAAVNLLQDIGAGSLSPTLQGALDPDANDRIQRTLRENGDQILNGLTKITAMGGKGVVAIVDVAVGGNEFRNAFDGQNDVVTRVGNVLLGVANLGGFLHGAAGQASKLADAGADLLSSTRAGMDAVSGLKTADTLADAASGLKTADTLADASRVATLDDAISPLSGLDDLNDAGKVADAIPTSKAPLTTEAPPTVKAPPVTEAPPTTRTPPVVETPPVAGSPPDGVPPRGAGTGSPEIPGTPPSGTRTQGPPPREFFEAPPGGSTPGGPGAPQYADPPPWRDPAIPNELDNARPSGTTPEIPTPDDLHVTSRGGTGEPAVPGKEPLPDGPTHHQPATPPEHVEPVTGTSPERPTVPNDRIEPGAGTRPEPYHDGGVYNLGDDVDDADAILAELQGRGRERAVVPDDGAYNLDPVDPPPNAVPAMGPDILPESQRIIDNRVGVPDLPPSRTDCIDGSIALASDRPYEAVKSGIDRLHDTSLSDIRDPSGMVRSKRVDEVLDSLGINYEPVATLPEGVEMTHVPGANLDDARLFHPDQPGPRAFLPDQAPTPPSEAALSAMFERGKILLPEAGHMRVAEGCEVVNGRTYVRVLESQGNPPFSQLISYDRLVRDVRWNHARLILR